MNQSPFTPFEELGMLVASMRREQVNYFNQRDKGSLLKAKLLEHAVDVKLKEYKFN